MRKHLKPGTPARASGRRWAWLSATAAAPGRPVDHALPGGCLALQFQRGDGGGFGQAVQGHVDQRGVAAGGGGARGGGEALPFGAAGLVDVDVGVDQAGENGAVAEVGHLGIGGQVGEDRRRRGGRPAGTVFEQQRGAPRALSE